MYQSIESVMLTEFVIDTLALSAALRPRYRISLPRLMCAAAAGALCSGAVLVAAPPLAVRVAAIPLVMIAMICICTGRVAPNGLPGAMAGMLAVSALMAAGVRLAGTKYTLAVSMASAVCAGFVMGSHKRWLECWEKDICIMRGMESVRFSALIDTGNRLREPVSGLPVLVAEEKLLRPLLPDGFDPAHALKTLPGDFRLVAFGGVGGNGMLGCFIPDRLTVGGSARPAPDMWIAVYPGSLPGRHRALAPPALIEK